MGVTHVVGKILWENEDVKRIGRMFADFYCLISPGGKAATAGIKSFQTLRILINSPFASPAFMSKFTTKCRVRASRVWERRSCECKI